MRLMFDIEFDLDLLILAICSMYVTKKILDACCKEDDVPYKMKEPVNINLDNDSDEI